MIFHAALPRAPLVGGLCALVACWPPLDALERAPVDASNPEGSATSDGGADAPNARDAGDAYAAAVLDDAPLAYYRLNEGDGPTVRDDSGHGNDAVLDGTFTRLATGLVAGDGALSLSGAGRIDVGDRFAFGTNDDFTIEAWIMPESKDADFRRIAERESLTPETGISLFVRGSGDPRIGFSRLVADQTREGAYTPAGFSLNTTRFTHVVAVSHAATDVRLYVDGSLVDTGPISASAPPNAGARFFFGGSVAGTNFVGALDELAVYGSALSDVRVRAHYDAGRNP